MLNTDRRPMSRATAFINGNPSLPYPAVERASYWVALLAFLAVFCFFSSTASATPPQRIVSLAPNMTEILFDLGLGDRVVGVTRFCDWPTAAKRKPQVGATRIPSLRRASPSGPTWGSRPTRKSRKSTTGLPPRHRRLCVPGPNGWRSSAGLRKRARGRCEKEPRISAPAPVGCPRRFSRAGEAAETGIRTGLFAAAGAPDGCRPGTVIDDAMTILGTEYCRRHAALTRK